MRRVLITGASRGLGLEFVRQCLARKERVFAGARKPEEVEEFGPLDEAFPEMLTVLQLDVTDRASIDGCYHGVMEKTDGLDLLINNAGVGHTSAGIGDERAHTQFGYLDPDRILDVFRINAISPIMVVQRFFELLQRGGEPKVVQITSALGSLSAWSPGGSYSYDASKAALNMLNLHLAMDLRQAGITSVVVHPGWVRTDMGGPNAPLTPTESVQGILRVIDGLGPADAGRFLQWNGSEHPW